MDCRITKIPIEQLTSVQLLRTLSLSQYDLYGVLTPSVPASLVSSKVPVSHHSCRKQVSKNQNCDAAAAAIKQPKSGYGQSTGGCLLCSRDSGVTAVTSYSFGGDLKPFPPINMKKSRAYVSKRAAIVCLGSSNNQRRNPDFSRQNRQNPSFPRNKNRSNIDKESPENPEEELLSSKNGPVISLSSSPKYQSTATPGPREKEIIELFRKVQAQLRQRTTVKEENKIEATTEGQDKESETVDSLLKLLRKHSVDQGKKRSNSSGRGDELVTDQQEQKSPLEEERNTSFFESNNGVKEVIPEPTVTTFKRPPSNFRRMSPVPRIKYQPVISVGEKVDPVSPLKSKESRKKIVDKRQDVAEPESELELDSEPKVEDDLEPYHLPPDVLHEVYDQMSESEFSATDEEVYDDKSEQPSLKEHADLSALKVPELRELAKSRGLKGIYKMKKGELVELLMQSLD